MSHCLPDPTRASLLPGLADARAYVASVCFKHGPPRLVGTELEWFVVDRTGARPPAPALVAALREALGPHAPRSLDPEGPARPLPHGSPVTVEPGGQVELSPPPRADLGALVAGLRADVADLDARLAGVGLVRSATPPPGGCDRVLDTPRYAAMEAAFDAVGPSGRAMMCRTAATQVCVDLGEPDAAPARWRLAHALGPVLAALFAVQPGRLDAWWRLDPRRTRPPDDLDPGAYVDRVLDTPVLAVVDDAGRWQVANRDTPRDWYAAGRTVRTADLDVHLSTLFPPVRPQGYLELRWADAQPGEDWVALVALVAAAFSAPDVVTGALAACAPVAHRWDLAGPAGAGDPALRAAATALAEVLDPAVATLGLSDADVDLTRHHLARRVTREAA